MTGRRLAHAHAGTLPSRARAATTTVAPMTGPWRRPMGHATRRRSTAASTPLELLFDLVLRRRRRPGGGALHHALGRRPRRERARRLPDGVLRHLVGVDELHVVRVGLRQRRRRLPARGVRADRRRADPRGRRAARVRAPRLHGRDRRLRRHAGRRWSRSGCAPAAHDPERRDDRAAIRRRHRGRAGRLGRRARAPRRWPVPAFLRAGAWSSCWCRSWAERGRATTPWHPHHIAERYGLFTIIVLGESILSATVAVQAALDAAQATVDARAARRGRAADRVLDVVDLLRPSRPRGLLIATASRVPLGLRPLLRLRQRGRGGRRASR